MFKRPPIPYTTLQIKNFFLCFYRLSEMKLKQEDCVTLANVLQSDSALTELHLEDIRTGEEGDLGVVLSALTDHHCKLNKLR